MRRVGSRRRSRFVLGATLLASVALVVSSCVGTSGRQVRAGVASTAPTTGSTIPEPDCAESLPTAAKAGQLLMVMVADPGDASDLLSSGSAGGFGLKGRQPADVGDAVREAVADAPIPPFVASDEEGGTTQRLSNALGSLPSAAEMSEGTPESAGSEMGTYATKMKDLGFNMVFGPVADVGSGSGLGSRSFGEDPETVASYVTAIVDAVQTAGLIAVVKHWPGIGGGSVDPHDSLASLAPIEDLRASDLVPFRAATQTGVGGVMVSHSIVPGLTSDDEPASLSKEAITGELRGALGYQGLVITDSLGMGAIAATTPQDEAAERAIAAGADIALVSGAEATSAAHARLVDAIGTGRIAQDQVERSVRRVLSAKGISGPCPDIVASTTRATDQPRNGARPDDSTEDEGDDGAAAGPGAVRGDASGAGGRATADGVRWNGRRSG